MSSSVEGFAERLRQLLAGESVLSFAQSCEIPESSMRNYLNGRLPAIDVAAKLAEAKGVSLEWLISGRGAQQSGGESTKISIPSAGERGFTLIPRLDIQASAGNGSLVHSEEPIDFLAFQESWLRTRKINPKFARVLTTRGDSMEPTIRDGDVLLVDTSVDRIKDNAIYVLVYGDMVLVKRIHGKMNGSLQIISDNPLYPPEEVSPGEVDLLNIAGRVVWFGRSI